jgi:hypothetical protein
MAIDFVLAFALIWASAFGVEFARSRAHAEGLLHTAVVRAAADLAAVGTGEEGTLPPAAASPASSYLLLSLAAAAVAAFNLAFWRHLRRAYASPRRGRRRG